MEYEIYTQCALGLTSSIPVQTRSRKTGMGYLYNALPVTRSRSACTAATEGLGIGDIYIYIYYTQWVGSALFMKCTPWTPLTNASIIFIYEARTTHFFWLWFFTHNLLDVL